MHHPVIPMDAAIAHCTCQPAVSLFAMALLMVLLVQGIAIVGISMRGAVVVYLALKQAVDKMPRWQVEVICQKLVEPVGKPGPANNATHHATDHASHFTQARMARFGHCIQCFQAGQHIRHICLEHGVKQGPHVLMDFTRWQSLRQGILLPQQCF